MWVMMMLNALQQKAKKHAGSENLQDKPSLHARKNLINLNN